MPISEADRLRYGLEEGTEVPFHFHHVGSRDDVLASLAAMGEDILGPAGGLGHAVRDMMVGHMLPAQAEGRELKGVPHDLEYTASAHALTAPSTPCALQVSIISRYVRIVPRPGG